MIIHACIISLSRALRVQEEWEAAPHQWLMQSPPAGSFQVPLASVWGLDPVLRLAGALETRGRLSPPSPVEAFHSYEPSTWYREWLKTATEIDDYAELHEFTEFPQLLGTHSPVALNLALDDEYWHRTFDHQTRPRNIAAMLTECQKLLNTLGVDANRNSYPVEWLSCQTLITILNHAQTMQANIGFFATWPRVANTKIEPYMMAARGFHRIRSVRLTADHECLEVTFINHDSYRLQVRSLGATGLRVSEAEVAERNGTVAVRYEGGHSTELTPRRILELGTPISTMLPSGQATSTT